MMVARRDVDFEVEGGVRLRGWLFVPENGSARHPAISMAHGYAGVKEHGLERFASAFTEAGFVVLVHDHRNFGSSDGAIRHDIDPWRQIADWRRAISLLESLLEVDRDRIGVWGTSYAGGHVLVLAATDRRIQAVVAQVPTISGYQQGLRRVPPYAVTALEHSSMTMSGRSFAASRPTASRWLAMIRRRRHPIDRGKPFPSISSRCRRAPG
jgi:uncharacterized protein